MDQGISGLNGLPRMVKDLTIIILAHVSPPMLPHIQIWMVHMISQTLVIHVEGTTKPIKIVSPNIEGKNHYPQI